MSDNFRSFADAASPWEQTGAGDPNTQPEVGSYTTVLIGVKLTCAELQDSSSTTTQGRGREEIDFVLDHARYIKIVKGQRLKSMRHQGLTGDLSF